MTGIGGSPGENRSTGLLHPFKSLFAGFTSALHTRLELFVTELEEERERLKQTLVLALLVFFGLSFGFILLTIFVVALLWERGWIFAIGGLAGVYLAIGIAAGVRLRQQFLDRPALFASTMDELGKDRERLRSPAGE